MKPFFTFLCAGLCMLSIYAQEPSTATTPKKAFLEKWENSKNYLIGIAEAMPEEFYNFKPSERQMSFKEQLVHIKGNMDWLGTTYFSAEKKEEFEKESKQEVIAALENSFNLVTKAIEAADSVALTETVDFFAGPKTKLQILNLLQDHVTHHRGQLIVYLNLKEITPPRYIGW
ncbi:DinB family protein [Patiriisocius hiemis]|uniref:DinB family protein n=1 Tax=Patiriisocius hiemis TaxID=3075604 RepID=A0ABU2YCV4_9FLAO|nr:DinB family protein [Constantimarinum sp. W242]MDT0555509.1 DinB family protein [Constantimarinum sp. W242]